MIESIVFDFGGVVAEEGFRDGLRAIGAKNGLDPEQFFAVAGELIYGTGYVTGQADEAAYWNAVRQATGLRGADAALRQEIIARFVPRRDMLEEADRLRKQGLGVSILSDQTDWLDEVDRRTHFSLHFDHVFNSFYLKKSKRDSSLFPAVAAQLGRTAEEILFVDDNGANLARAASQGWKTILFRNIQDFRREMADLLPACCRLPLHTVRAAEKI